MQMVWKRAFFSKRNVSSKFIWCLSETPERLFCITGIHKEEYKVVIAGGGAGGASMAARMCSKLGSKNVLVIEPSDVHYYQPYWTLVGGGIVDFEASRKPMVSVLPKDVRWLKDEVTSFTPAQNTVDTKLGSKIKYDFLIVALGLRLGFEMIEGLPEAFETPGVCSNYSPLTVKKTATSIKSFLKGNAIFTQPVSPIKCAGAPQKIAYLADDIFRKSNKRKNANILFYTALDTIFAAPKYGKALRAVAEKKAITVNYKHNLIEVKPNSKEAVFENLSDPNASRTIVKYDLLHITPPMFPPTVIKESALSDSSGYLNVNKFTLQHNDYQNVFGIGDCLNIPTSKTAAAVAAQCGVLSENILSAMKGKPLNRKYNGYTSCPLVTGNKKAILAEFDFDLMPIETLPIDQSQERYISYVLKKDVLPFIYWNLMLRGYWEGPGTLRKIFHLGMC